jgi:predicted MPP superfamily phosphohydrolase
VTIAFVIGVAVLLGLLLFLINEARRPPGPAKWGRVRRWPKRVRVGVDGVILLLGVMIFYGFLIEPGRLTVRQETLPVHNWPQNLDGLRIAVIGDIHFDDWFINDRKVRSIVDRTNQLQPDLIVLLGDFMSSHGWVRHTVAPEVFTPLLKDFHAPLGVYAVLGNHDWWYNGPRVRAALEHNGIKVLENEVAPVNVRGTSIWLVGLADLWTRPQLIQETVARVPEGQTTIALAHNPDIFPQLPQRVPLLLAAHTHGGQVRFPLLGSVVESSRFGDRYAMGHISENGHDMFVTTGIGTSIIAVRFGVPPEIVLLTIRSGS